MKQASQHNESALYWGTVYHSRRRPIRHDFNYGFMQWFLALDELETIDTHSRCFSTKGFAPLWFRQKDYFRGHEGSLEQAALAKMSELAGHEMTGRVFFLGNIRTFGLFFSPVNFYFLQQQGAYTHLLAEVSNTPWLERHYYLVDLNQPNPTSAKQFHVSPFNPMDMTYRWHVSQPSNTLHLQIDAEQHSKDFIAGMNLTRHPLNRREIWDVLKKTPVMAVKIIGGIYWQALKLFVKRAPYYSHPKS